MKTRKKKREREIASSRLRTTSGHPCLLTKIKLEIKKKKHEGFSRGFDRLSTKGRRWRFSSIRVAEGLEKGGIEGEDENLRAAVYYRDEGVV